MRREEEFGWKFDGTRQQTTQRLEDTLTVAMDHIVPNKKVFATVIMQRLTYTAGGLITYANEGIVKLILSQGRSPQDYPLVISTTNCHNPKKTSLVNGPSVILWFEISMNNDDKLQFVGTVCYRFDREVMREEQNRAKNNEKLYSTLDYNPTKISPLKV